MACFCRCDVDRLLPSQSIHYLQAQDPKCIATNRKIDHRVISGVYDMCVMKFVTLGVSFFPTAASEFFLSPKASVTHPLKDLFPSNVGNLDALVPWVMMYHCVTDLLWFFVSLDHYLVRLRIWIYIFDITMRNFGYVGFLFKSCEQLLVFRLLSLLVDQKRLEFARPYDCTFLLDVRLEKYLSCAYDLWGQNFVSTDEVSLLEIYVTKADTWACTQP